MLADFLHPSRDARQLRQEWRGAPERQAIRHQATEHAKSIGDVEAPHGADLKRRTAPARVERIVLHAEVFVHAAGRLLERVADRSHAAGASTPRERST